LISTMIDRCKLCNVVGWDSSVAALEDATAEQSAQAAMTLAAAKAIVRRPPSGGAPTVEWGDAAATIRGRR
jgi:hypothetical protein